MDYRRGTACGMTFQDGRLRQTAAEPGWFFSRVLDSREREMIWHRLRVEQPGHTGGWTMRLYSSDSRVITWENGSQPVDELIADTDVPLEEKKRRMQACQSRYIKGDVDVLLFDVRGRYLWFLLETDGVAGEFEGISGIRIDFPKESWVSWLPEVYQGAGKSRDFLERYLGIFQSFYEEMTEQIERSPEMFDPDCAPERIPFLDCGVAVHRGHTGMEGRAASIFPEKCNPPVPDSGNRRVPERGAEALQPVRGVCGRTPSYAGKWGSEKGKTLEKALWRQSVYGYSADSYGAQ